MPISYHEILCHGMLYLVTIVASLLYLFIETMIHAFQGISIIHYYTRTHTYAYT